MQRALVWLNLYSCEAVQQKLKNSLKTPNMHFLPVFELMSDSLTTIQVEPHQCPLHQSILLTQGPIQEIFAKKFRELAILKNKLFLAAILKFIFSKKKKLLHSHVKRSKFLGQQGWVEILMIILVSSCLLAWANILHPSVLGCCTRCLKLSEFTLCKPSGECCAPGVPCKGLLRPEI